MTSNSATTCLLKTAERNGLLGLNAGKFDSSGGDHSRLPLTLKQLEMVSRLQGLSAIVTGSSSGNGRAIALALAAEGATVLCSDLNPEAVVGGYRETEKGS